MQMYQCNEEQLEGKSGGLDSQITLAPEIDGSYISIQLVPKKGLAKYLAWGTIQLSCSDKGRFLITPR